MDHERDYGNSRRMAERLAGHAADQADGHPETAAVLAAAAQAHATLALAAATLASAPHIEDEDDDE